MYRTISYSVLAHLLEVIFVSLLLLRSTFDLSFGRVIIWIQDYIMVHHHCTDFFFFLILAIKLVGLTFFFLPFFRELGRQRSTIELDTPSVKLAQLQTLEEVVNAKIRDHVSVTVQVLSLDDPAVEKVHTVSKCYS